MWTFSFGSLTRPQIHVGDVQQTVDAAEVHKGAERGDVFDQARADLPFLDLGEEFLLQRRPLVLQQLSPADDDVVAALIDEHDLALDGLADVVADVGGPANVHLAGGQKDVDADVDQQAALDLASDGAGDHVAVLVLGDDVFPFLLALGLAIAENDGARLVFGGLQQQGNLLAQPRRYDLAGVLVVPLARARPPLRSCSRRPATPRRW